MKAGADVAFLRGGGVELRPADAPERARLRGDAWLRPHADAQAVALALARPGHAPLGLVALQRVDWIARRARLAAWWREGAAPDWEAAAEALRLVVAYAADELNLDRLDAEAGGGEGVVALAAAGFEGASWRRPGGAP